VAATLKRWQGGVEATPISSDERSTAANVCSIL